MSAWIEVKERLPEIWVRGKGKPYVLVCDAKGRMSVAYRYGEHEQAWTMAKPIGLVTHWCELPAPPEVKQ